MNESLPPKDDAELTPEVGVAVLCQPEWAALCKAATEAKGALVIYDEPDNESHLEARTMIAMDLTEMFGTEYVGGLSAVKGLAYDAVDEGQDYSPLKDIDSTNATYSGCDIQYINQRWQVVLEFYICEDSDIQLEGYYYVPVEPGYLETFCVYADDRFESGDSDEVQAMQLIKELTSDAQAYVAKEAFLLLGADEQRVALGDIAANLNAELPSAVRDKDLVVECLGYYSGYADMPGFVELDAFVDLGKMPSEDRPAIVGEIIDFAYPELAQFSASDRLTSDSFLRTGAPCMIVRDSDKAILYYIPADIVTGIS